MGFGEWSPSGHLEFHIGALGEVGAKASEVSGGKITCGSKGGEGHTPRVMILKCLKNVTQNEFVKSKKCHPRT